MWKVRKSKIHGKGIVATQNIKKGQKIIQYIGEKILNQKEIEDQKKNQKVS